MPEYEYRCLECKRRFNVFMTYQEYGTVPIHCTRCGSENVTRKIGRIRIARSEESRLENLSDPSNLDGLDEDPRALGKMMRTMSSEMGEELGPEFNEVVDRLEKGQSPDEIEKALPDLGDDGGALDDDF